MPHVLCTEMLCVSLIFFSPLSLFHSNAIEKPLLYIDDIAVAIQSELYHFKSSFPLDFVFFSQPLFNGTLSFQGKQMNFYIFTNNYASRYQLQRLCYC